MPKNTQGGKKFRGKKKTTKDTDGTIFERKLEVKSEGQEYARVSKLLGNCRVLAVTNDGSEKLCIIPRKFKFKVMINKDDVILITIRGYQNDKADVIYKYYPREIKQLIKMGQIGNAISESFEITHVVDEENQVVFDEESDEESDSKENINDTTIEKTVEKTVENPSDNQEIDEIEWAAL
jgi:translation initiation factor 1A